MNRATAIIGTLIVVFVLGAFAARSAIQSPFTRPFLQGNAATSPEIQTQRLTSFFLLRRIERLRETAVYLQHREEGGRLVELME